MLSRVATSSTGIGYRYGFNGKEDDFGAKGALSPSSQDQLDYGNRIYDPRVGRFLSVDRLADKYPWYTPYQFAGNKPIWATDLDGLEESVSTSRWYFNEKGGLINTVTSDREVIPEGMFWVGLKRPQTIKEQVAEMMVEAAHVPHNGEFIFVENPDPKHNYAYYTYKDDKGNERIVDYDALYIQKSYETLGLRQEKAAKYLNVAAAILNLGVVGVLAKGELNGLSADLKAASVDLTAAKESAAQLISERQRLASSWGLHTEYVDFNSQVYTEFVSEGETLYQYRIPGTDKGSYFVKSLDIKPEDVGLSSADYSEVYKVKVTKSTNTIVTTHTKNAPYWRNKNVNVNGGGKQVYSPELKNNATFEKENPNGND